MREEAVGGGDRAELFLSPNERHHCSHPDELAALSASVAIGGGPPSGTPHVLQIPPSDTRGVSKNDELLFASSGSQCPEMEAVVLSFDVIRGARGDLTA
ncbi:hypothetical protein MUK42_07487 [Musa troglodytarum]|uniref:Uncharacterized protein n=1 Tax=Musa troglodytarum TaxID=320322 RepID=A0A9E7HZA2_9LILI|nr:hypothetical protein MUK42_07487 [Musa troglodytarum]